MDDIRIILGIKIESPHWDDAYKKALAEPAVPQWLTIAYIDSLQRDCNVLRTRYAEIAEAVFYVAEDPALSLLAKTLYRILEKREPFSQAFTHFELPKAPDGIQNTIGFDCVGLFPILAHLRPSWAELAARGIDASILSDSLIWADFLFDVSCKKAGKIAFTEEFFKSYTAMIYSDDLIIGRLRFEVSKNHRCNVRVFTSCSGEKKILLDCVMLHKSGHILGTYGCTDEKGAYFADFKETDTAYEGYAVDKNTRLAQAFRTSLSKADWRPVLQPGDSVIKVHIPYGGKLEPQQCEASYRRARRIFTQCYPEFTFSGFLTCCWMLSPELRDILPPTSNILAFQKSFEIFPIKNSALDAFFYVYGITAASVSDIDLECLPEANSIMGGIKQKSLSHNYIYQFGGFFSW